MSATAFQAMLHAGKVSGTGERELKKHLRAHLGQGFCPTRRSVDMLSDGHGIVHYGSLEFTYNGKAKPEFIEWTEKNLDDEITLYLQRHLSSKSISPSDVKRIQVVAGGDHGDVAFQFGALVSVEMTDARKIEFEVSVCEVICRKDTAKLIEDTILPRLTNGLEVVKTVPLSILRDKHDNIKCQFTRTPVDGSTPILVDLYITGDLAFQAMALGKESMAGHWCMQCKSHKNMFLDDGVVWTMEELVQLGKEAENNMGIPKLGVKQQPWWPFIPISHYMIPLLHCEIGIGNQLLDKLREIVNEYIESYAPGEELIRLAIPVLKNIIEDTAKMRDSWDTTADGKLLKKLIRKVASKHHEGEVINSAGEAMDETESLDTAKLKELQDYRASIVNKLEKARKKLADQQQKLKGKQSEKKKGKHSIETNMFKALKEIGVELSSYHGGSLNGKDIKKVMNNASHIFDQFAVIFKDGKRPDCILSGTDIDTLCLHFREVFVLWDGAFSLARTVNPTENDTLTYMRYVSAAIQGNTTICCTITPKVHLMLKHVQWQMRNIPGGLGDKMEDWVERLHQTGMRERQRFRTVQNPIIRALAREKAGSRNMHPDVLAQVDKTNEGNKRNLVTTKVDTISTRRKQQRDVGRQEAMEYFDKETNRELTWLVLIFGDEKVDSYSKKDTSVGDS